MNLNMHRIITDLCNSHVLPKYSSIFGWHENGYGYFHCATIICNISLCTCIRELMRLCRSDDDVEIQDHFLVPCPSLFTATVGPQITEYIGTSSQHLLTLCNQSFNELVFPLVGQNICFLGIKKISLECGHGRQ